MWLNIESFLLKKWDVWAKTHIPPPACSDETLQSSSVPLPLLPSEQAPWKLVLIFHDESTFHATEDQGWIWGEKGKMVIRPKGQDRGIMVSDFIDEHNGYLALTNDELEEGRKTYADLKQAARVKLKIGAEYEGYWNSENFLEQIAHAIKIAKIKYSSELHNVLWFFDHSSGHTAFPDDALNINCMNVKQGGKQPKMHDTKYNGKVYCMVITKEGPTKGWNKGCIGR